MLSIDSLSALQATLRDVRAQIAGASLHIDEISVPDGVARRSATEVEIPLLSVANVRVDIPDVRAMVAHGRGAAAAGGAFDPAPLLDALSGELQVDLEVDIELPMVGRRAATHEFRIAIARGVIDYRAVERDLAALEDAVIDIELVGDKLIIEKDIPLVPFDEKTLIAWKLNAAQRALASKGLVALSTLLHPEIPAASVSDPRVVLNSIAARRADIRLDLGYAELAVAGGIVRVMSPEGPGVRQLCVSGDASYASGGAPRTNAAVRLGEASLAVAGVVFGSATMWAERIAIGPIEAASVQLEGFIPTAATAVIKQISAYDVRLALAPRPV